MAPKLVTAAAVVVRSGIDVDAANAVTLTFDQAMETSSLLDHLRYSFDGGLAVLGVAETDPADPTRITIFTTQQLLGREYRVFVSGVVKNTGGVALDTEHGSVVFSGYGSVGDFVVSDLEARSSMDGRRVHLLWNDPSFGTVARIVIHRRQRSWAFSLSDPGTVVFDGSPTDLTGTDTEGVFQRFYEDAGLKEMTFYYYVVGISQATGESLDSLVTTDASRVLALSSGSFNSKEWIARKGMIPKVWFALDREEPGLGALDDTLEGMGGWLDRQRSLAMAPLLVGNWETTPYSFLKEVNKGLGFEPEGDSYDFDTLRRTALSLLPVYNKKGRTDAIVSVVRILTGWECEIQQLGVWERSRLFGTYDPEASRSTGELTWTQYQSSAVGDYTLTDTGRAPWVTTQWQNSRCLDGLGNWVSISDNTTDTLSFVPEDEFDRAYLTASCPSGQQYLEVDGLEGVLVGQRLMLRDSSSGNAEVIEVTSVSPTIIRFWNELVHDYPLGSSYLSWAITRPQIRLRGTVQTTAPDTIVVDPQSGDIAWNVDQWEGFKVLENGIVRTIVGNDETGTLTFDDGITGPGTIFDLAADFASLAPVLTFTVYGGGRRPTLYNRLWDKQLRGTRLDPFSYFYGGASGTLRGAWGACDLGIYIRSPEATLARGRASGVSGVTLTDTSRAWTTNALVGMYLNPNQNQGRLFQIISNTATTITVAGSIGSLSRSGQPYTVFTPRNATRFTRLSERIREFVPDGINPRVLFL